MMSLRMQQHLVAGVLLLLSCHFVAPAEAAVIIPSAREARRPQKYHVLDAPDSCRTPACDLQRRQRAALAEFFAQSQLKFPKTPTADRAFTDPEEPFPQFLELVPELTWAREVLPEDEPFRRMGEKPSPVNARESKKNLLQPFVEADGRDHARDGNGPEYERIFRGWMGFINGEWVAEGKKYLSEFDKQQGEAEAAHGDIEGAHHYRDDQRASLSMFGRALDEIYTNSAVEMAAKCGMKTPVREDDLWALLNAGAATCTPASSFLGGTMIESAEDLPQRAVPPRFRFMDEQSALPFPKFSNPGDFSRWHRILALHGTKTATFPLIVNSGELVIPPGATTGRLYGNAVYTGVAPHKGDEYSETMGISDDQAGLERALATITDPGLFENADGSRMGQADFDFELWGRPLEDGAEAAAAATRENEYVQVRHGGSAGSEGSPLTTDFFREKYLSEKLHPVFLVGVDFPELPLVTQAVDLGSFPEWAVGGVNQKKFLPLSPLFADRIPRRGTFHELMAYHAEQTVVLYVLWYRRKAFVTMDMRAVLASAKFFHGVRGAASAVTGRGCGGSQDSRSRLFVSSGLAYFDEPVALATGDVVDRACGSQKGSSGDEDCHPALVVRGHIDETVKIIHALAAISAKNGDGFSALVELLERKISDVQQLLSRSSSSVEERGDVLSSLFAKQERVHLLPIMLDQKGCRMSAPGDFSPEELRVAGFEECAGTSKPIVWDSRLHLSPPWTFVEWAAYGLEIVCAHVVGGVQAGTGEVCSRAVASFLRSGALRPSPSFGSRDDFGEEAAATWGNYGLAGAERTGWHSRWYGYRVRVGYLKVLAARARASRGEEEAMKDEADDTWKLLRLVWNLPPVGADDWSEDDVKSTALTPLTAVILERDSFLAAQLIRLTANTLVEPAAGMCRPSSDADVHASVPCKGGAWSSTTSSSSCSCSTMSAEDEEESVPCRTVRRIKFLLERANPAFATKSARTPFVATTVTGDLWVASEIADLQDRICETWITTAGGGRTTACKAHALADALSVSDPTYQKPHQQRRGKPLTLVQMAGYTLSFGLVFLYNRLLELPFLLEEENLFEAVHQIRDVFETLFLQLDYDYERLPSKSRLPDWVFSETALVRTGHLHDPPGGRHGQRKQIADHKRNWAFFSALYFATGNLYPHSTGAGGSQHLEKLQLLYEAGKGAGRDAPHTLGFGTAIFGSYIMHQHLQEAGPQNTIDAQNVLVQALEGGSRPFYVWHQKEAIVGSPHLACGDAWKARATFFLEDVAGFSRSAPWGVWQARVGFNRLKAPQWNGNVDITQVRSTGNPLVVYGQIDIADDFPFRRFTTVADLPDVVGTRALYFLPGTKTPVAPAKTGLTEERSPTTLLHWVGLRCLFAANGRPGKNMLRAFVEDPDSEGAAFAGFFGSRFGGLDLARSSEDVHHNVGFTCPELVGRALDWMGAPATTEEKELAKARIANAQMQLRNSTGDSYGLRDPGDTALHLLLRSFGLGPVSQGAREKGLPESVAEFQAEMAVLERFVQQPYVDVFAPAGRSGEGGLAMFLRHLLRPGRRSSSDSQLPWFPAPEEDDYGASVSGALNAFVIAVVEQVNREQADRLGRGSSAPGKVAGEEGQNSSCRGAKRSKNSSCRGKAPKQGGKVAKISVSAQASVVGTTTLGRTLGPMFWSSVWDNLTAVSCLPADPAWLWFQEVVQSIKAQSDAIKEQDGTLSTNFLGKFGIYEENRARFDKLAEELAEGQGEGMGRGMESTGRKLLEVLAKSPPVMGFMDVRNGPSPYCQS